MVLMRSFVLAAAAILVNGVFGGKGRQDRGVRDFMKRVQADKDLQRWKSAFEEKRESIPWYHHVRKVYKIKQAAEAARPSMQKQERSPIVLCYEFNSSDDGGIHVEIPGSSGCTKKNPLGHMYEVVNKESRLVVMDDKKEEACFVRAFMEDQYTVKIDAVYTIEGHRGRKLATMLTALALMALKPEQNAKAFLKNASLAFATVSLKKNRFDSSACNKVFGGTKAYLTAFKMAGFNSVKFESDSDYIPTAVGLSQVESAVRECKKIQKKNEGELDPSDAEWEQMGFTRFADKTMMYAREEYAREE